jgi:hypothetical protein
VLDTVVAHWGPLDHLDIHDPSVYDVEDEHAFWGRQRNTAMAGTVRLPFRMDFGVKALTEVVAATTFGDQPKIPRADGELEFPFFLQQSHQLCYKVREDFTNEGVLLFHQRTVAETGGGRNPVS